LPGAGAHHLGGGTGAPLGNAAVEKAAGGEIPRSQQIAGKGQGDVVFGIAALIWLVAELAEFVAQDAFLRDIVRPGSGQAGGHIGTVEIHQQVMFRRTGENLLIPLDDVLIAAVHEVDFDSGGSPFFHGGEGLVDADAVQVVGMQPQHQFDILLFGIGKHSR